MTGQQPIKFQLDSRRLALCDRHILLVEDCVDQGRLYRKYLQQAGAEVRWDACGVAAVDSVRKTPTRFDAVLMDFQMPSLNGLKATRQLREIGYRGAIVAFTSFGTDSLERIWLEAGCDELIDKPSSKDEIIEAILRHVLVSSRVKECDV